MRIMPPDVWTSSFRIRLVQRRKMGTPRLFFGVSVTQMGKKDFNELSFLDLKDEETPQGV